MWRRMRLVLVRPLEHRGLNRMKKVCLTCLFRGRQTFTYSHIFYGIVDFLVLSTNANIQARLKALAADGESRLKEAEGSWYGDPRDWKTSDCKTTDVAKRPMAIAKRPMVYS